MIPTASAATTLADLPSPDVAVNAADNATATRITSDIPLTDGTADHTAGDTHAPVELAATSSVAATRKRKARGSHNRGAQDERKRKRRAALLLTVQGNTEAGT